MSPNYLMLRFAGMAAVHRNRTFRIIWQSADEGDLTSADLTIAGVYSNIESGNFPKTASWFYCSVWNALIGLRIYG